MAESGPTMEIAAPQQLAQVHFFAAHPQFRQTRRPHRGFRYRAG
jgi:hypothetical protein